MSNLTEALAQGFREQKAIPVTQKTMVEIVGEIKAVNPQSATLLQALLVIAQDGENTTVWYAINEVYPLLLEVARVNAIRAIWAENEILISQDYYDRDIYYVGYDVFEGDYGPVPSHTTMVRFAPGLPVQSL